MTDTYNAGRLKISASVDISQVTKQLNKIERQMAASGKTASQMFTDSLAAEFKSGFGDKFKSSVFDALDASDEGMKAGDFTPSTVH